MFAEIQKEDLHAKPDDHFHGTPLYMGMYERAHSFIHFAVCEKKHCMMSLPSRLLFLSTFIFSFSLDTAPELWGSEPFDGKKSDGTSGPPLQPPRMVRLCTLLLTLHVCLLDVCCCFQKCTVTAFHFGSWSTMILRMHTTLTFPHFVR